MSEGLVAYREALRTGDAREALATIDRLIDAGMSFDDLCEDVIRAALYEIGDEWEAGEIGVADEHLATSISETVLACVGSIWAAPADASPRILVCCTEGEAHAVGARMVGEAFAAADWAVHYLGPSVPVEAVASAVVRREPDVVALSTTMSHNLDAAAATIARVRRVAADVRIVAGGRALDARVADDLGADLYREGLRGLTRAVEASLA